MIAHVSPEATATATAHAEAHGWTARRLTTHLVTLGTLGYRTDLCGRFDLPCRRLDGVTAGWLHRLGISQATWRRAVAALVDMGLVRPAGTVTNRAGKRRTPCWATTTRGPAMTRPEHAWQTRQRCACGHAWLRWHHAADRLDASCSTCHRTAARNAWRAIHAGPVSHHPYNPSDVLIQPPVDRVTTSQHWSRSTGCNSWTRGSAHRQNRGPKQPPGDRYRSGIECCTEGCTGDVPTRPATASPDRVNRWCRVCWHAISDGAQPTPPEAGPKQPDIIEWTAPTPEAVAAAAARRDALEAAFVAGTELVAIEAPWLSPVPCGCGQSRRAYKPGQDHLEAQYRQLDDVCSGCYDAYRNRPEPEPTTTATALARAGASPATIEALARGDTPEQLPDRRRQLAALIAPIGRGPIPTAHDQRTAALAATRQRIAQLDPSRLAQLRGRHP